MFYTAWIYFRIPSLQLLHSLLREISPVHIMSSKDEAKDEHPEQINLKVMGQDGNVVQFKIKKHTALKKLMSTYCERAGLDMQTIRFTFDGNRIKDSDTPKDLDMEEGDTIEVFQQQSGGDVGFGFY